MPLLPASNLTLKTFRECPTCKGKGATIWGNEGKRYKGDCSTCEGKGRLPYYLPLQELIDAIKNSN